MLCILTVVVMVEGGGGRGMLCGLIMGEPVESGGGGVGVCWWNMYVGSGDVKLSVAVVVVMMVVRRGWVEWWSS